MTPTVHPRNILGNHVILQEVESETLIYDEHSHKAWCLNRSSACIWRLCDSRNTVQQIATQASAELALPVSDDLVLLALAELREQALLQPDSFEEVVPDRLTRREMMARTGLAAVALLPVIAALAAPPAASALSGGWLHRRRLQSPGPLNQNYCGVELPGRHAACRWRTKACATYWEPVCTSFISLRTRGLAHDSSPSPNRVWALVVEIDSNGKWTPGFGLLKIRELEDGFGSPLPPWISLFSPSRRPPSDRGNSIVHPESRDICPSVRISFPPVIVRFHGLRVAQHRLIDRTAVVRS